MPSQTKFVSDLDRQPNEMQTTIDRAVHAERWKCVNIFNVMVGPWWPFVPITWWRNVCTWNFPRLLLFALPIKTEMGKNWNIDKFSLCVAVFPVLPVYPSTCANNAGYTFSLSRMCTTPVFAACLPLPGKCSVPISSQRSEQIVCSIHLGRLNEMVCVVLSSRSTGRQNFLRTRNRNKHETSNVN